MTNGIASTARYGTILLQVTLGLLFLAHLALKLFALTPAGTIAFFASLHLSTALVYLTRAAGLACGLALIHGIYARFAAITLVPLMLGTIVTVHDANGFFSNADGGWEYSAVWAVMLVVLALIGDGAASLIPTRLRARNV